MYDEYIVHVYDLSRDRVERTRQPDTTTANHLMLGRVFLRSALACDRWADAIANIPRFVARSGLRKEQATRKDVQSVQFNDR